MIYELMGTEVISAFNVRMANAAALRHELRRACAMTDAAVA
jgi:hypothetical protein